MWALRSIRNGFRFHITLVVLITLSAGTVLVALQRAQSFLDADIKLNQPFSVSLHTLVHEWRLFAEQLQSNLAEDRVARVAKWHEIKIERNPFLSEDNKTLTALKLLTKNLKDQWQDVREKNSTKPLQKFETDLQRLDLMLLNIPTDTKHVLELLRQKRIDQAQTTIKALRFELTNMTSSLTTMQRLFDNNARWSKSEILDYINLGQSIVVGLFVFFVVYIFYFTYEFKRWSNTLGEWTQAVKRLVATATKNSLDRVELPQVDAGIPKEIVDLAVELKHMQTTLLERGHEIVKQKEKLTTLNQVLFTSNQRLKLLLENMSAGVLVVRGDNVESYNQTFTRCVGLNVLSEFVQILKDKQNRLVSDFIEIEFYGRILRVKMSYLDESRSGQIFLIEDVTAFSLAQSKLKHAQKLFTAGVFSAQVAHEIRNPLNSMSLNLEMLAEDLNQQPNTVNKPNYLMKRIEAIQTQITQLTALTERYLKVGRSTETAPFSNFEFSSVIEQVRNEIDIRDVKFKLSGPLIRARLRGDRVRLIQILTNLMKNALEATNNASGNAEVQLLTGFDHKYIKILVCDLGPGISTENEQNLFSPFFTSKPNGSGLGLSIAKQLALELGGDVNYSRRGSWTVFELRLPVSWLEQRPERSVNV